MPALLQNPCVRLCDWDVTDDVRDGLAVFSCGGCASEWVRSEPWAPCDDDGTRKVALRAEIRCR